MPRKKHSFNYIYKTTCLVTSRYYIGMHSTSNLEDGYIGSGKGLWNSIRKHGRENHVMQILEFHDSREQLRNREREIVNSDLLLELGGCYLHGRPVNIKHDLRITQDAADPFNALLILQDFIDDGK